MFTIHNIEYQGWAHPYFLGDVLGLSNDYESRFSYNGSINFLKGAILDCDAITTVSRSYAAEICEEYFAHGLADIISEHSFKLRGIVNGIDVKRNDPVSDPTIVRNYCADDFSLGKAECKAELQRELGLPTESEVLMIGIVSRLVGHKGFDIICDAIDEILSLGVQLVVLGTGEREYEERLRSAKARYPQKLSVNLEFSTALASRIYAASDVYLMPSKSEPCGLSQLLAMRYGSVPIVHETGGLKDTVIPFNNISKEGVGFTFQSFSKDDMLDAICRALEVYSKDKETWKRIVYNGMTSELSWKESSEEYMRLYEELKK